SLFNFLSPMHIAKPFTSAQRSPSPGVAIDERTSLANPPQTAVSRSKFFPSSFASWLPLAWAVGAVSLAGYLTWTHYRISRRVTLRRPLIDAPVMTLLEDCKQMMGVRAPITLVETDEVGSPAIFGFVRPRLLLPAGLLQKFSRHELRFVFLHELSHIKRG